MSQPAITVSPDDTVRHAAWLMYDRRVERLPVVDGADRLAEIVSRTDVLTVYSRPDQEICRQITGELLLRELLTDPLSYRVTVREGIVTLPASRKLPPSATRSSVRMICALITGMIGSSSPASIGVADAPAAAGAAHHEAERSMNTCWAPRWSSPTAG